MMKRYLTIMLAALMLCAMSFSIAGKAWAEDAQVTTKAASQGVGVNTTDSSGGGHTFNWNLGYDPNGGKTVVEKILGGSSIGGTSGSNHGNTTSVGVGSAAGMVQTTGTGVGVGSVGVGGGSYGSGISLGNLSFGGGSGIFSTAINKMLNLFGNVKLLLYVVAAFGLVGFAFMAIFGKVRWGWVCALAFGLAAVAAAGQIIDYVSQSGMGSTMGDTLGANAADFSTIN